MPLICICCTENTDYEGVSVNIEFSGSTPMEEICNTVSTVDDIFVEDTELFFMSLTTSESLVTIPVQSVVALILDNDGVFHTSLSVWR